MDSDFYRTELNRVFHQLLPQRKSCLVKGLPGSGKSMFLEHIKSGYLEKLQNAEKYKVELVDFADRLVPSAKAAAAKVKILEDLEIDSADKNQEGIIAIYLFDNINRALAKSEIYDSSFFQNLREYQDSRNLIYVITLGESLPDTLQDVDWEEIQLGGVSEEDVSRFVRGELGAAFSSNDVATLLRVAGHYPFFLVAGIEEVKDQLERSQGEFRIHEEELEKRLVRKEIKRYGTLWKSLGKEEQGILQILSTGRQVPKGNSNLLNTLRENGLVSDNMNSTFSTAFDRFVRECTESAPLKQHGRLRASLLYWDRGRTLVAMLILLMVYSIAIPVLVILGAERPNVSNFALGFFFCFAVLLVIYILQNWLEHRPK